jgi:hypothetical protein
VGAVHLIASPASRLAPFRTAVVSVVTFLTLSPATSSLKSAVPVLPPLSAFVLIVVVPFGLALGCLFFPVAAVRLEHVRPGAIGPAPAGLVAVVTVGSFVRSDIFFAKIVGSGFVLGIVVEAAGRRELLAPATVRSHRAFAGPAGSRVAGAAGAAVRAVRRSRPAAHGAAGQDDFSVQPCCW